MSRKVAPRHALRSHETPRPGRYVQFERVRRLGRGITAKVGSLMLSSYRAESVQQVSTSTDTTDDAAIRRPGSRVEVFKDVQALAGRVTTDPMGWVASADGIQRWTGPDTSGLPGVALDKAAASTSIRYVTSSAEADRGTMPEDPEVAVQRALAARALSDRPTAEAAGQILAIARQK